MLATRIVVRQSVIHPTLPPAATASSRPSVIPNCLPLRSSIPIPMCSFPLAVAPSDAVGALACWGAVYCLVIGIQARAVCEVLGIWRAGVRGVWDLVSARPSVRSTGFPACVVFDGHAGLLWCGVVLCAVCGSPLVCGSVGVLACAVWSMSAGNG